jgi:hypothetical protein
MMVWRSRRSTGGSAPTPGRSNVATSAHCSSSGLITHSSSVTHWEQEESGLAQVSSFKPGVRGSSLNIFREGGGVNLPLVLELKEEAVTTLTGKLRRERHRLHVLPMCGLMMLAGMHV